MMAMKNFQYMNENWLSKLSDECYRQYIYHCLGLLRWDFLVLELFDNHITEITYQKKFILQRKLYRQYLFYLKKIQYTNNNHNTISQVQQSENPKYNTDLKIIIFQNHRNRTPVDRAKRHAFSTHDRRSIPWYRQHLTGHHTGHLHSKRGNGGPYWGAQPSIMGRPTGGAARRGRTPRLRGEGRLREMGGAQVGKAPPTGEGFRVWGGFGMCSILLVWWVEFCFFEVFFGDIFFYKNKNL